MPVQEVLGQRGGTARGYADRRQRGGRPLPRGRVDIAVRGQQQEQTAVRVAYALAGLRHRFRQCEEVRPGEGRVREGALCLGERPGAAGVRGVREDVVDGRVVGEVGEHDPYGPAVRQGDSVRRPRAPRVVQHLVRRIHVRRVRAELLEVLGGRREVGRPEAGQGEVVLGRGYGVAVQRRGNLHAPTVTAATDNAPSPADG
ncbi:hypothetical protein F3K43_35000 [Streptomyces sp. LBUM 1476]|nr:hypothetical protein [Streptomyces sp. LBUM 1476]